MHRAGVALMLVLGLGMIAVGAYVLGLPEEASGKECGGAPLTVLVNGATGAASRAGLGHDCNQSAGESVALGFSTMGIGVVIGVTGAVLRG